MCSCVHVMCAAHNAPIHAQHASMQWELACKRGARQLRADLPVHRMPRPPAPGPASAALDLSQAKAPWSQAEAPWSAPLLLCGQCMLTHAVILGYAIHEVGITPVKDRRAWKVPAQAQQSGAPEQLHAIAWPFATAVSSQALQQLAECLCGAGSNHKCAKQSSLLNAPMAAFACAGPSHKHLSNRQPFTAAMAVAACRRPGAVDSTHLSSTARARWAA